MRTRGNWLAAVLVVAGLAITSCSASSPSASSGGTGLIQALARVADTANTRSQVLYDDTAELVHLAGNSPASETGFAWLRGLGVPAAADGAEQVPGDAGFNLFGEDYGITAGSPPHTLSLMAGGQSVSRITSHLAGLGWKHSGGRLIGPSLAAASPESAPLAEEMPQVLPAGSDAVYGGAAANLSQMGSPHDATLARDPGVSALAQCLGNVVAAELFTGGYLGGKKPAAVAVGVSQPASNAATPHAVACVSWPNQAAMTGYAAALRQALSNGT